MKPVDLSGEMFAVGVMQLAHKHLREHGRTAVTFVHGSGSDVVYEIRIKSINGVAMSRRVAKALKASGSARQRAR